MLRRAVLLALPLAVLSADERTDALDAIAPFAAALSNGDAGALLESIPKDARELRRNLAALIARAEVTSSVEVVTATKSAAELDWYMEIRDRITQTVVERRRGKVQLQHRRRKLLSLEPASFFAPPSP
jgi:hypothetical protein